MPGMGFCCCCNDIYASDPAVGTGGADDQLALYKIRLSTDEPATIESQSSDQVGADFDPVHKRSFGTDGDAGFDVYEVDVNTLIKTDILSVSPNRPHAITCDVDNERLFFTEADIVKDTDRRIRRCNYDGTGVTTIVTTTIPSPFSRFSVLWARGADKLVVRRDIFATPRTARMETYNADGSGVTTIYTTSTDLTIRAWDWDNRNNKIWFIEEDVVSPFQMWIKRCNIDGTTVETMLTGPQSPGAMYNLAALQFSNKLDRALWYQYDPAVAGTSDTNGGLFYMESDGSNVTQLVTRREFGLNGPSANIGHLRLGCGFETTGSSSLG